MKIELYDKVLLKDGRKAFIVYIYEMEKAYEADIYDGVGIVTDTIMQQDIEKVL